MPIALVDGRIAVTSLKAAGFVRENAPGPYTSLVVHRNGAIPFWKEHNERLEQSVSARCSETSARAWECDAWSLDKARRDISCLQLASKVEDVAQGIREIEGTSTDASVIICIREKNGSLRCNIHASPIKWPTGQLDHPTEGAILFNGSRINPQAKDSQWAHDRSPLESQLEPGTEGILAAPDGRLLEGLVTSLFIVREDNVVQTAHPASDGVLDGIMRREILHQCNIAGLKVVETAPRLHESHFWQEAFCTNCLRLIQPMSKLSTIGEGNWQNWSKKFTAPGPITSLLYKDLQNRLLQEII